MILHQPYGHDDPYRPLPVERTPHDPQPGEAVQVSFQTGLEAQRAWVEFADQRLEAQSLGQGYWTASLGRLQPGHYSYTLATEREQTEAFEFEVGRWLEAERLVGVEAGERGVQVELGAQDGSKAVLSLSFPLAGVCKAEFCVGKRGTLEGLPCGVKQEGDALVVVAEGAEVHLDLKTLELQVVGPKGAFKGSARLRWLVSASGDVSRLEGRFTTQDDEELYGLGERFTGAGRKGQTLDVRVYEEYKEQGERTYIPVPFIVSSLSYGVWLAAEEPSYFELGEACTLSLDKLPAAEASFPLHVLVADEPYGVTSRFVQLTGPIAVPPKWAFGPWMSANTWNTQAKAEAAVRRTLAEYVPATVLVLEAWSDETTFYAFNDARYRAKLGGEALGSEDYAFGGCWPDPRAMIEECHQNGIKVLLWQIPVLKHTEDSNPQHDADLEHALRQGYVIQNADGSPYRNKGWWFTDSYVLDFSNPQARDWWFSRRKYLLELGVDGFKTDGGEHLWGRDLRSHDGRRGLELYNAYPNQYVGAYHGFMGEGGLTFSRSGYTGAQRFPAHWAGDENSTWAAFKASIQAGLSAGLSGVSMWGWDIGGFSGEIPNAELYLRSTAMAAFCPVMQYHSELHGSADLRDRTPWNIAERQGDGRALEVYRRYAKLRMRLLDYLHDEAKATAGLGIPMMRYPYLAHPEAYEFLNADPHAYLFGRDLLVAPVVEKGTSSRLVRLPLGGWVYLWSGAKFAGGQTLTVPAPLERIPVFVRAESPRLGALLEAAQSFGE